MTPGSRRRAWVGAGVRRACGVIGLAFVVAACAAPGCALTQVGVTGRLIDADGAPVAGEQIELKLPAKHGLAGLDRVMLEPSAYGHHSMSATVVTDSDGRFSWRFPQTTYSISYFFIPPLGPLPRKPPPPTVGVRTAGMAPDWLVVRPDDETVECRLFDDASNSVGKEPDGHVTGSAAIVEPSDAGKETRGLRGWRLGLTIRRP
jgi:hypothetical protein